MTFRKIAFLLLPLSIAAQVPEGWNERLRTGADFQRGTAWWGAGVWAADSHGPSATFVNTLGLGNTFRGGGIHLEAGLKEGNWELAGKVLGVRDEKGEAYLTLYQGHASWESTKGWLLSLEQEPLVWGFGLNGGYLLGEAARPFPRIRVKTPMRPIRFLGIPFGTWGLQAFVGRLERNRLLGDSVQDQAWRRAEIIKRGDPQNPMFHGYRAQAKFGDSVEFYANYTNLWSGTLNGEGRTNGYNLKEYLTAMFGLKDALAEANADPNDPNRPPTPVKSKARSASNADIGIRIRLSYLEKQTGAEAVHAYISRGTKNMWWTPGHIYHKPLYYLGKDLERDGRDLLRGHFTKIWNETGRYTVPNPATPANNIAGILLKWPKFRFGIEYADTVNTTEEGARTFMHFEYITGFYTFGDPLGNAISGETNTTTIRMESELSKNLSFETWIHVGFQPFRDQLEEWQKENPGATPAKDRFHGIQQIAKWKVNSTTQFELGASWRKHSASNSVENQTRNGFRWFANLSFRWPSSPLPLFSAPGAPPPIDHTPQPVDTTAKTAISGQYK